MASGLTAGKLWHFHFMQFASALQNLKDDANITDIVINGVRSVLVRSAGHTFDEALLKLRVSVRKTLATRLLNARRSTSAARGVKAGHRG